MPSALARPYDVLAVGEGIETMLSLRCALPAMPMAAALSANHLAALLLPADAASALHRPRRRCRGRHGARGIDRTRRSRRHRGARPVSAHGRLQRGPARIRPRRASGGAAHPTRAAGWCFLADDRAASTQYNFHHGARCGSLGLHQHGGTSMFDEIFFPRAAERYRAAPLVEQRERYLVHLKETGARRPNLRKCANDQLSLVRLLD